MALPINVEDLLYQRTVEQTRIEYKEDWNPEPIIHTITAFANDFDNMGGGYILIGVEEENGRPIFPLKGVERDRIESIQQDILNKCNFIEPRYIPVIEPCVIDGVDIIVLSIYGGEERPYRAPEKIYTDKGGKKSSKSYYIRKGSRTIKANHREEQELISMTRDVPFDDRINYNASVEDMRPALMADFLHRVGSELYSEALNRPLLALATDMRVVRGPVEYKKPVNAGLMFFSEEPDKYFPYAMIEVVDKPDPTGIGMTEKTFKGPLDKQLQEALAYIRNYIVKEYVTKVPDQAEAVRVYNWPYRAIEEALSNAVYHRSYQEYEPITVTVTPEKLDILSLPGPDRSISDEDLENGVLVSSRYRNRRIGNFLKELKLIEGRNTGVPLIISAMEANGSDRPKFLTDEDRTYFRTVLPIHPMFLKKVFAVDNNEGEKPEGTSKQLRRNRKEIVEAVITALENQGDMSMKELAETLGYSGRSKAFREEVNGLLKSGRVRYLIPDKPNSRNQKICLVREE